LERPNFGRILIESVNSGHDSRSGKQPASGFDHGTPAAPRWGIMTAFFILLALVAAGLMTELIAANQAPFGYQDESGFHFGDDFSQPPSKMFELENPS